MKQLIEYIVSNIVNHPESVIIDEQKVDAETTKYLIKVDPEDVGRVIGKQGKVIKSIRQIVRIAAIQKGTRAVVDLLEEDGQKEYTESAVESEESESSKTSEETQNEE